MTTNENRCLPFKIGFGVLVACLSGPRLPIKMAFALLFIAMGTMHFETKLGHRLSACSSRAPSRVRLTDHHDGNGIAHRRRAGMPCCSCSSIPIDIWALGLVGERLSGETPPGAAGSLGPDLGGNVRSSALSSAYCLVHRRAGHVDRYFLAHSLLDMELLKAFRWPSGSVSNSRYGAGFPRSCFVLLVIGLSIVGNDSRHVANRPARQRKLSRADLRDGI